MGPLVRKSFAFAGIAGLCAAAAWATSFGTLPPADFTFCNGTEIKTIDPAIATGQPEGRIIEAIFEGLCNWDPKTLEPTPGVAHSWDISEDRLTYTFHLRPEARWSNGRAVTADDFHFSFRRFLDPMTASEYAYQLWYVTGGKKYTVGPIELGDPVEVELLKPPGTVPTVRGEVIRGTLVERPDETTYVVEIGGLRRRFTTDRENPGDGEVVERVLFDFEHVGIRVKDAQTLEITLDSPTPFFLSLMGFYPLFPVNRECVEAHGYPDWTKPENLVSNGAYRLESRRIRDRIRMVKSDTYWDRDHVTNNVVDALSVTGETTMLNLYMTGEADWTPYVPQSAIPELLRQNRPDFQPEPVLITYFYLVNVTKPPMNDVRVRRALSLAMNRDEIVSKITRAGEVPAYGLVPPGIEGYEQAHCEPSNLAEAKRLLAEAGYPEGRGMPRVEILYNTMDAHQKIAEILQAQWKRGLGIDVRLANQEWAVYLSNIQKLDYSVARRGWVADYADPNTYLDMFVTGGSNNQSGWSNAKYDRLIHDAASEVDPKKRLAMLHEAEEILLRELPIIPIYFYVDKNMVAPYVKGFHRNAQDYHPAQTLHVDAAEKQKHLAKKGWTP